MSGISTCDKQGILVSRSNGICLFTYPNSRELADGAINRAWSEMTDAECAAWLRARADEVEAETATEEVTHG
ncbi:hypothetical protein [Pseudohongiella acticola]|uniref:hypothetical protein n=1 Tax=Pseudohongiella acticola TaxID=1524254 RepID=UPI0030EB8DC7